MSSMKYGGHTGNRTASVPPFAMEIRSIKFEIDMKDPIVCDDGKYLHSGRCFLHNVVATFKIETDKITLTQRELLASTGLDFIYWSDMHTSLANIYPAALIPSSRLVATDRCAFLHCKHYLDP
jgi:hypothetical protein